MEAEVEFSGSRLDNRIATILAYNSLLDSLHSALPVPLLLLDGVEGTLLVVSHLPGQLHKVFEWTWVLLRMFLNLDFCSVCSLANR